MLYLFDFHLLQIQATPFAIEPKSKAKVKVVDKMIVEAMIDFFHNYFPNIFYFINFYIIELMYCEKDKPIELINEISNFIYYFKIKL